MPEFDAIADIHLSDDSPVLLFGWRPRPKHLEAKRMSISASVGETLLSFASGSLGEVAAADVLEFSETQILQGNQVFLSSLDEYAVGDGADQSATDLSTIVDLAHAQFPELSPEQIKGNNFAFYVVVAKTTEGVPIAFLKMPYNMTIASPGKILTAYSTTLTRLETPVFALSDDFDLIIHGRDVYVLRAEVYLRLLSDAAVLQSASSRFVSSVKAKLGVQLSASSVAAITGLGEGSARVARQLRRLSKATWLGNVDVPRLDAELKKFADLGHGMTLVGNNLEVPEAGVDVFLKIIEQVIWRTPFAGDVREAQAYASVI